MTNAALKKMSDWTENGEQICLWIGRAKLPHIGHIAFLKTLKNLGYKLVIANGSCYTLDPRNPIHAFQIQVMLGLSLMNEGLREDDFTFIPLPDFEQDEEWRNHLTAMPHFGDIKAIATGNDWVLKALSEKISGAKIIGMDAVKPAIPISATKLREALRDNNLAVWEKHAAFGTKVFTAHAGGFARIRNAILGNEINFVPGRQCVDLICFVHDGFEWCVVTGLRAKGDFSGRLALPGGGINAYESPPDAALREWSEETGIAARVTFPWSLPMEIAIGEEHPKMAHLHFVNMYGTTDVKVGGTLGGSSLCFMTVFEGSTGELKHLFRGTSDLLNVGVTPVAEALRNGLAFQQTEMLKDGYQLLEHVRRI